MPGHDTNAPGVGWLTRTTESARTPGLTLIVKVRSAVRTPHAVVTLTRTVNGKSPVCIGVPEIKPSAAKLSPGGKGAEPGDNVQVCGAAGPPPACNWAEYATLFVASGRLAVLTRNTGSPSS